MLESSVARHLRWGSRSPFARKDIVLSQRPGAPTLGASLFSQPGRNTVLRGVR